MRPRLASDFFNTFLAIHPAKGMQIASVLRERVGAPLAFDWGQGFQFGAASDRLDYDLVDDIAIIEASGYLIPRAAGQSFSAGFVGCDEIAKAFSEALDDRRAKAIALVIDSIGGEVGGCLDLSDLIFEARNRKPIAAILDESAYAGAYAIASSAEQVTIPRTGGAGAVGVAMMHLDVSRAVDRAGLDVTLVQYGAHKSDGSELVPLDRQTLDRFQQDVDTIGEMFVSTVARNRGLSRKAVRAQQAATYLGAHAVDAGLADYVLSPTAAFEEVVIALRAEEQ